MKIRILLTGMLLCWISTAVQADIFDVRVTETWTGLPGADGTADWFEITNFGDTTVDTGTIFYDDSNPMLSTGGFLESFALAPGQSAVFLTSIQADNPMFDNAFLEYLAIWGNTGLIGLTGGGGNLGAGGDSINLFQVDGAKLILIDTLEYTSQFASIPFTIERIGQGFTDIRNSVLGENGAFESNPFQDDNMMSVTIVGSPGIFKGDLDGGGILGDINCDGAVNLLDVAPFVALITDGGFNAKADINGDGLVNLLDVSPFVALLSGG